MRYLDEARFAPGARSAAWIETEVANQTDPPGFARVAADEPW
ncbi:MAG: hypothetical protein ACM31C_03505 [Acidobacteriota bacterium]